MLLHETAALGIAFAYNASKRYEAMLPLKANRKAFQVSKQKYYS